MKSGSRSQRRWQESCTSAGRAFLPYGFAAYGIALGIGGIVEGAPIVGACGAVAGVTVGLLERHRGHVFNEQIDSLRHRLRRNRSEAEVVAGQLRQNVTALRVELAELRPYPVITMPEAEHVVVVQTAAVPIASAQAASEPVLAELTAWPTKPQESAAVPVVEAEQFEPEQVEQVEPEVSLESDQQAEATSLPAFEVEPEVVIEDAADVAFEVPEVEPEDAEVEFEAEREDAQVIDLHTSRDEVPAPTPSPAAAAHRLDRTA